MAFLALVIVIVVQRWLSFRPTMVPVDKISLMFKWIRSRWSAPEEGVGFFGVAQLVLLPVVVVMVLFGIVHSLLGFVGYFVLAAVLLWVCLDIGLVHGDTNETSEALLRKGFLELFCPIFWFGLLGPFGLLLVVVTRFALVDLTDDDTAPAVKKAVLQTLGVLDWVPVRLLGLSYALVGQFGSTFKVWIAQLQSGINHTSQQAIDCGEAALGKAAMKTPANVQALLDRALWVWVVVLALISIGMIVG